MALKHATRDQLKDRRRPSGPDRMIPAGGRTASPFIRVLLSLLVLLHVLGSTAVFAQAAGAGPRIVVYKTLGADRLHLWIYEPGRSGAEKPRPAVILFHGGGWRQGSPKQFSGQARHLAGLGMVAVGAEYRLSETGNHNTPLEAVLDAKSAIRWVRANAATLHIDPRRIAAAGGSAGGHLALSAAIVNDLNEASDDLAVSAHPDALVLFNPVVSLGSGGLNTWGKDFSNISPLHRLKESLPSTLIMHGTADKLVPFADVQEFVRKARATGSRDVSIVAYEGRPHGFFNRRATGDDDYAATLQEMVRFFQRIGWIESIGTGSK